MNVYKAKCRMFGLEVTVEKSEVMIVGRGDWSASAKDYWFRCEKGNKK